MKTTSRISPEQRELDFKRAELARVETQLSERELELATLRTELRGFEGRYLRVVGSRFARRDDLEAQVAEALAQRRPRNVAATREAFDSRTRATQSAEAVQRASSTHVNESFAPTDSLKTLFRAIAKLVHPDLTTEDDERERRNRVMTAANEAYAAGDAKDLQRILDECETSPEAVRGEGIGADLVRTIRKIHQANQRLSKIHEEFGELQRSQLYELKERYDAAQSLGRDLLVELADQLDGEIVELRRRLDLVLKGVTT